MPFMEPEIVFGDWYMVDGPMGTEYVPTDVEPGVPPDPHKFVAVSGPGYAGYEYPDGSFPMPGDLEDYFENTEYWTLEVVSGWGVRLSAPGYLDATPWSVFDTEKEAVEYLEATYNEDED
jgi:hypothetical protein